MEKKEFKKPSVKVMNLQAETILAGSGDTNMSKSVTLEGFTDVKASWFTSAE